MSDRTGRKPKGVMSRPAPDWFSDHMGTGGYWAQNIGAGTDLVVQIQLFNDDQNGQLLKVYGISAGNDSGTATWMFTRQGQPLGSFVSQGPNVRPDLAAPSGQIWQLTTLVPAANPDPTASPPGTTILGTPGFDSNSWFSPFPLAVIAPGWSVVIMNPMHTGTVYAAYWWQVSSI